MVPNTSGLPGRMSTPSNTTRAPSSASAPSTKSYLPIETPPLTSSRSAPATAWASAARMAAGSSRTIGWGSGSPPARTICAASVWRFESRIWAGAGVDSTDTSSSPVASTATRGRATTCGRATPSEASRPMVAGSSVAPAAQASAPARSSLPRGTTFSPATTGRRTWMSSPARSVCSTITTASVPGGSGAPVMISTQAPPSTRPLNAAPAATSPTRRTAADRSGLAPATSAARTANPSRVERSNGG